MKKTVLSLATLAVFSVITPSAHAIPALSWTVDELVVDSIAGGPPSPNSVAAYSAFSGNPTSFLVNDMSLEYEATLIQGPFNMLGQASFTESGRFLIGKYNVGFENGVTNGTEVPSALGANIYDLWGTFSLSGTAQISGTQLFVTVLSGIMDAYIDITPTNDGTGLGAKDMDARIGGATSILSGGAILNNIGNNDAGNGSFEVIWSDFGRDAFGSAYWPAPTPFHMKLDINSDVDAIQGAFLPGGTTATTSGQGNAYFAVPEPTSLSLIALALMGMGFAGRKRKQ